MTTVHHALYEIPGFLGQLWQEVCDLMQGHPPLMIPSANPEEIGHAFLMEPCLFPAIIVPTELDSDWSKVGFGLVHLHRSLSGLPALDVHGNDADKKITSDINNELEYIAIIRELEHRRLPLPPPIMDLDAQVNSFLQNVTNSTLEASITFLAFRVRNRLEEGLADAVLQPLTKRYPSNAEKAKTLGRTIQSINLGDAKGVDKAAHLILDSLEFTTGNFFLREFRLARGRNLRKSLGNFRALHQTSEALHRYHKPPHAIVEFELPFCIPIADGIYSNDATCITLQKIESNDDDRRTWHAHNAEIEPKHDQSGMYYRSKVAISIANPNYAMISHPPPDDFHRVFESYTPLSFQILTALNELISWSRHAFSRPDIPSVTLLHLNKLNVKTYDENGNLVHNIPFQSFETVTVTAGPPTSSLGTTAATRFFEPEFHLQLLGLAKLACGQADARKAILDLCGAFESFVHNYLKPKLDETAILTTTKTKFLRTYGQNLPSEIKDYLERQLKEQESAYTVPIRRLVKQYQKMKIKPELNNEDIRPIHKAMDLRNDAAHGRELPEDSLGLIADAIDAFERLAEKFD